MAVAAQSFPAPVQFGKYWLDAELAVGGMARLYRARLRGPGGFEKKLVLKQILPHLSKQPSFIELLVREANTLVRLSHPNIVPVYELGVVDGVYFLAMELVEGATVAELLHSGPLAPELCAEIAVQVCEALQYAHAGFGLVHRDVTPRNLIIDGHGHVKLLDFGIAAPLEATGRGEFFGSPGYMSPEQMRGEPLTPSSDLFSLGRVLGEALTGVPAAEAERVATTAQEHPGPLEALIAALTQADPRDRPKSAAAVALQLRTWLAQAYPAGVAPRLAQRVVAARAPIKTEARGNAVVTEPLPARAGATHSLATRHGFTELIGEHAPPGDASATLRQKRHVRSVRRREIALAALAALAALSLYVHLRARAGSALDVGSARASDLAPAQQMPDSELHDRDATSTVAQGARGPAARQQASAAATRDTEAVVAPNKTDSSGKTHPTQAHGQNLEDPKRQAAQGIHTGRETERREADAAVTINAVPWAYVRVDDRSLGATPQRALALRPGHHVVTLSCPPLGRSASVPLEASKGGRYQLWVDLMVVPPRVTLE